MRLSIRALLTLWYATVVALIVFTLGLGVYFSAAWSVRRAIDSDLTSGIDGVTAFLRHKYDQNDIKNLGEELREHSALLPKAKLLRGSDARGVVLYETPDMQLLPILPASADGKYSRRDAVAGGRSFRYFSRICKAGPDFFLIEIGEDETEYALMLRRLACLLTLSIPIAAVLAALCGYWMSERALRPIHRITSTASLIDAQNLQLRLPLRGTNDELDFLSKTLNSMFDRIELAYGRVMQFTADASHELRTPVAVIRANAEYLLMEKPDEERTARGIADILKESEFMTRLVGDLLTLARADRDQLSLEKELFEMEEAFGEIVVRSEILAALQEIRIVYQPARRVVAISGYRNDFQRVAVIFIDNAIRYSPRNSQITVATWSTADECGFTVSDHGIGISPADQEKIFERFYRVDQARTQRDSGTGLGLAIAKEILASHMGRVAVESEVGRGSLFTISLPRADRDMPQSADKMRSQSSQIAEGPKAFAIRLTLAREEDRLKIDKTSIE
jgi:heavy metal sensor kinase